MAKAAYPTIGIAALVMFGIVYFIGCLLKNGHVYLFDTKSVGSDVTAPEKHNALLQYIHEYSTEETPLSGGIIIQKGSNWLYSKLPIENTTDLLNWDTFYPENA